MRAPLEWLGELVDLPPDAQLAERLELGGFEDVRIERLGPDLGEIRVGLVRGCERHPAADRLSVCRVDLGDGEERSIVCGAPNVAAGQKVAVALPGTRLPDGTKLKKSKLRGVVSEGMICSTRELGLGDEHAGILLLDPDAPVGAALPEVLGAGDRVLEVGITPNRGDAASLLGLAREVRAFFGGELRLPPCEPDEAGAPAAEAVRVAIEAPDGCFHYVARVVRDVRIAPSPDWVARRLEACGVRPINNVVDVTNLVLFELGQPLHAFDLAEIGGGEIRVRRAAASERLATLDGQTRPLEPGDLVIADARRAVALAGVMGGAASEVGQHTRDVLIESAHFHPSSVRLTARRLGLHSEASYRFERGVDAAGVRRAADRAARLLAELAGGRVAPGTVEARGAAPARTETIAFEVARAERLLGLEIGERAAASLLERVGVACEPAGPGRLSCRVPSHRNDLELPEDLVEEVARIHGYEKIPATLPLARLEPARQPRSWQLAERARDALAAAGLTEVITYPFVGAADLEGLGLASGDPRREGLRVLNPIQEQDAVLRTALLPSLLRLARQNLARQIDRVRLFEVCRVFIPRGEEGALPEEPLMATAVVTAPRERHLWSVPEAPPLFFEVRGVAERLLSALGYVASLRRGGGAPYLHPGAEVAIEVDGRSVGAVGELHPSVSAAFEIDAPCALFELNLDALSAAKTREIRFREVSREPQVRRDLAVLLDRTQAAGEVVEAIRKSGGPDLISVELFDRYEGRGVPEGRVSLGFRLVFQRADRTLTDAEVAKASDRVVRMLATRFGAELR
jgi:phenylalanyl-tRNA synthetase beta chain